MGKVRDDILVGVSGSLRKGLLIVVAIFFMPRTAAPQTSVKTAKDVTSHKDDPGVSHKHDPGSRARLSHTTTGVF